jgi:hypothetical protein
LIFFRFRSIWISVGLRHWKLRHFNLTLSKQVSFLFFSFTQILRCFSCIWYWIELLFVFLDLMNLFILFYFFFWSMFCFIEHGFWFKSNYWIL